MQDEPTAMEILGSVIRFMRGDLMPQLSGNAAFQVRVAANALDLVGRELSVPAAGERDEQEALRSLLGRDGTTAELTRELARRIADGSIDPAEPAVEALLWAITEAKLDVDQPAYAGLRRARALRAAAGRTTEANRQES